jgi:hypothetical protein
MNEDLLSTYDGRGVKAVLRRERETETETETETE